MKIADFGHEQGELRVLGSGPQTPLNFCGSTPGGEFPVLKRVHCNGMIVKDLKVKSVVRKCFPKRQNVQSLTLPVTMTLSITSRYLYFALNIGQIHFLGIFSTSCKCNIVRQLRKCEVGH